MISAENPFKARVPDGIPDRELEAFSAGVAAGIATLVRTVHEDAESRTIDMSRVAAMGMLLSAYAMELSPSAPPGMAAKMLEGAEVAVGMDRTDPAAVAHALGAVLSIQRDLNGAIDGKDDHS